MRPRRNKIRWGRVALLAAMTAALAAPLLTSALLGVKARRLEEQVRVCTLAAEQCRADLELATTLLAQTREREAPTMEMTALAPAQPVPPVLESLGVFTVTAYCPCAKCCGKWADGITATGTTATQGRTIAVDPGVIPLGSLVRFKGPDGEVRDYTAEDTGGAIKGQRIDLYFDSHQEALEWGVQEVEVFKEVA